MVEVQGYHFFYVGNADERKMIIDMYKLGIPMHGLDSRYLNHSIMYPTEYHINIWSYSDLYPPKFTKTGRLRKQYHDYYWRVIP